MINLNLLLPGCNLNYNILNKNPFTASTYITVHTFLYGQKAFWS